MENEKNLHTKRKSAGRHAAPRHAAPRHAKPAAPEYPEYEEERVPAKSHAAPKAKPAAKKRKKQASNLPLIIIAVLMVAIIVAFIVYLPKLSAPKPTVETYNPNGDIEETIPDLEPLPEELEPETEPEEVITEPVSAAKVDWNVGDVVQYGNYKTDKGGNAAPLEWTVVERDGDYALLVCRNIVKFLKMSGYTESTWEDSYVLDWLNDSEVGCGALYSKGVSFKGSAFSPEEKAALVALGDAPNSTEMSTETVFVLSASEYEQYINIIGLPCYPTEYAVIEGQRIGLNVQYETARWWWLRSTDSMLHFSYVDNMGNIGEGFKDADNDYGGIRPAIWVDLTNVPVNAE